MYVTEVLLYIYSMYMHVHVCQQFYMRMNYRFIIIIIGTEIATLGAISLYCSNFSLMKNLA